MRPHGLSPLPVDELSESEFLFSLLLAFPSSAAGARASVTEDPSSFTGRRSWLADSGGGNLKSAVGPGAGAGGGDDSGVRTCLEVRSNKSIIPKRGSHRGWCFSGRNM